MLFFLNKVYELFKDIYSTCYEQFSGLSVCHSNYKAACSFISFTSSSNISNV